MPITALYSAILQFSIAAINLYLLATVDHSTHAGRATNPIGNTAALPGCAWQKTRPRPVTAAGDVLLVASRYHWHMQDRRKFVAATQWLRPYTRWSAAFAMQAPAWVPGFVRHLPLKLINLILRGYQRLLRDTTP